MSRLDRAQMPHPAGASPGFGWLAGRISMLFGVLAVGTVASFPALAFRTARLPDFDGGPPTTLVEDALALSLAGLPFETISGAVLGIGLWLAGRPYVPGAALLVSASMAAAALGQLASPLLSLGMTAAVAISTMVATGSLLPWPTDFGRLAGLVGFSTSAAVGIALAHLLVLRWSATAKVVWCATLLLLAVLDGVVGWWLLDTDWSFATVGLLLVVRDVPLTAAALGAALLLVVRTEGRTHG